MNEPARSVVGVLLVFAVLFLLTMTNSSQTAGGAVCYGLMTYWAARAAWLVLAPARHDSRKV